MVVSWMMVFSLDGFLDDFRVLHLDSVSPSWVIFGRVEHAAVARSNLQIWLFTLSLSGPLGSCPVLMLLSSFFQKTYLANRCTAARSNLLRITLVPSTKLCDSTLCDGIFFPTSSAPPVSCGKQLAESGSGFSDPQILWQSQRPSRGGIEFSGTTSSCLIGTHRLDPHVVQRWTLIIRQGIVSSL